MNPSILLLVMGTYYGWLDYLTLVRQPASKKGKNLNWKPEECYSGESLAHWCTILLLSVRPTNFAQLGINLHHYEQIYRINNLFNSNLNWGLFPSPLGRRATIYILLKTAFFLCFYIVLFQQAFLKKMYLQMEHKILPFRPACIFYITLDIWVIIINYNWEVPVV